MTKKSTHFIGIGGIGMSALARLLLLKNINVSGSDQKASPLIDELSRLGATITIGHDPLNLPLKGQVVVSSGIKADNLELKACDPKKHKILHRSEMLRELMSDQKALLVTGTHGKTTTSALLATLLYESKKDPTWAVGGLVSQYATNASLGKGEHFVAEADESDGTHLKYNPWGLIVTNIDEDHLDFFKTKEALAESLKAFIYKVKSYAHLFWCGDDPTLKAQEFPGVSYGFETHNQLIVSNFRQIGAKSLFDITFEGVFYQDLETQLIGRHNALNASSVIGLCLRLGLEESDIRYGLKTFRGVKRRAEVKSSTRETIILDDYAHHPTELSATLSGLKKAYPDRRLLVVFQPHRYSRTRDCFHEFAEALTDADQVVLTDIYSAGESPIAGVGTEDLLKTFKKAFYIPRDRLVKDLSLIMRPFDVVVLMGAGDITQVASELALLTPRKLKLALVFGGRSEEHEVSVLSARNVSRSFDKELVELEYFAISREGDWLVGEPAEKILWEKTTLEFNGDGVSEEALTRLKKCDLAFPVLHGTYGEEGTIQGFFEIFGMPYIGCGVESSAASMNKAMTKKLAAFKGVRVADFVDFTSYEWEFEQTRILQKIDHSLPYPLFVKPVHLGSTLGVKKVHNEEELRLALKTAFSLDTQVVVEKTIVGREIECSVIGRGPWFVSKPGEICSRGAIYEYENKYGSRAFEVNVEAALTEAQIADAQEIALRSYRAVEADGMARVDLFLDEEGHFYLNEINPIPGCTNNSLFPKMCEASGFTTTALMTHLIRLALSRKLKQDCLV